MLSSKIILEELFACADIRINGNNPWDIHVRDDRLYACVLKDGNLGLGESYMRGWWDCLRIDEFIRRLLQANLEKKIKGNIRALLYYISSKLLNLQSRARAGMIADRHYDLGNDLFFSFLDSRNQYSCGYFQGTDDLEEAQGKKLDLICRKINLQPSDHVLDIGCGWGGFARFAAEQYGCSVTAVNISGEQISFARDYCKGLPVTFLLGDYRQIQGSFDKVVSIGMFEHVGQKNYRAFMKTVHRCLKRGGIFLLHTIGSNVSVINCDEWINRYIFPNGMLPSISQIGKAAESLFIIEDLHNLCTHYHKTLLSWNERFQKAWPALAGKYGPMFKRMWEYYLLSCAGAFRARNIQVWQIVMSKEKYEQPVCRLT